MINPWDEIQRPEQNFNVRLVDEKHPLALYWGKGVHGEYLFVIQIPKTVEPPKLQALPALAGIQLAMVPAATCSRLVLLLKETANWELFKLLCRDLIYATEALPAPSAAVEAILLRLRRWHELLKSERKNKLSPEVVKGLCGELLFMKEVLAPKFGWRAAISFWKGPLGAPQDFAVHEVAIEVKTQMGGTTPSIRISSLDQMDPVLPTFFLVVNTLATADAGEGVFSLKTLVEQIRDALDAEDVATCEVFESLLFQLGYQPDEAYAAPLYKKVARQTFRVAEGFPRLLPAAIPEGITKVTYSIALANCLPFISPLPF